MGCFSILQLGQIGGYWYLNGLAQSVQDYGLQFRVGTSSFVCWKVIVRAYMGLYSPSSCDAVVGIPRWLAPQVRRGSSSSLSMGSQLSNVFPLHSCSFIYVDIHPLF